MYAWVLFLCLRFVFFVHIYSSLFLSVKSVGKVYMRVDCIYVSKMREEETDRWCQAGYGHLAVLWAAAAS